MSWLFDEGGVGWEPCAEQHRGPEGPNEDLAQCRKCGSISWVMRPENETIGFHDPDCSLDVRHSSYCKGGGSGHPPADVIRGYWPGYEADVARERARWARE